MEALELNAAANRLDSRLFGFLNPNVAIKSKCVECIGQMKSSNANPSEQVGVSPYHFAIIKYAADLAEAKMGALDKHALKKGGSKSST